MSAGEDGDQRLVREDPVREVARHLVGVQADERHVELAGADALSHLPAPVSRMAISIAGWRRWKAARARSTSGAACPVLPTMPSRSRPVTTPASSASSARALSSSSRTARARGSSSSPAAARRTERLVRSNRVTPCSRSSRATW